MTAGGLAVHAPTAQAATASASASASTAASATTGASTEYATAKNATAKKSRAARQRVKARTAVAVARDQLGDPYRYGGTGPGAFDCSGLVQYAWRKAGVRIPRVTNAQYARIKKKVSFKRLRPGDLMFFRGFGHVGMYVGKGKMIHSPRTGQTVRVEKLNGWRKASFVGAVRPGA
ncbi:C40 family peptidase [Nonomuraea lactucae]|uniref:C40 family peptidase n=1 Tax=Nonomuraea lactucae TaxID=2249762 RepID=UPI001F05BF6D|nr:C40 family peptidase [Nonomuraea lactucae]